MIPHWKKTSWNNYRLVETCGKIHDFKTYEELYSFCLKHSIDAVCV